MNNLLFPVIILVGFYFLLIRPEQMKQKKAKSMMNSLKIGDVIFTRGGMQGTIVAINDNIVTIATGPDNVKLDFTRGGIGSVVEAAPEIEEVDEDEYEDEEAEGIEVKSEINLDKKNEETL